MNLFTRFIVIDGDDYGALVFEQEYETQKERAAFAEEVIENDGELGCGDYTAYIRDYAGDISEEFLSDIMDDLCDYDALKGRCWYRVGLILESEVHTNA